MNKKNDFTCPYCKRWHHAPWGAYLDDVSWSDDCACGDNRSCIRHQYTNEDMPSRPPEEVLLAKAHAKFERDIKKYEALKLSVLTPRYTMEEIARAFKSLEKEHVLCVNNLMNELEKNRST